MDIQGKVAMITGGAVRVGRGIAAVFARQGAEIALHYRSSAKQAREAARELRAFGGRVELFQADLADPAQIESMFRAVEKAFGRVDVLVNNAAVFHKTPIETLTAEQWDLEMAVNARAPALCIRHVIPLMKKCGGAVVNIADIQAERVLPSYAAYCASKAALTALTQSAARALARYGIRVNSVSPGVALWPEGKPGKERKAVLAQIPLGRPGSPEEIAQAVLFLAQHEYVTGQNLRVDGGWSIA